MYRDVPTVFPLQICSRGVHNEIHTTRKPSKALPSGVSNQRAKGWQRANFVIRTVHKGHIRSPEGTVHLSGGLATWCTAYNSETSQWDYLSDWYICTTVTLPIHNSWNDITDDLFGRNEKWVKITGLDERMGARGKCNQTCPEFKLRHWWLWFCASGVRAFTSAWFGRGSGQILLDDVSCGGNETRLVTCPHRTIGQHNCGHHEDAGVRCVFTNELTVKE